MLMSTMRRVLRQWLSIARLLTACLLPPALGFNYIIRGPLWALQSTQVHLPFPLLCALIGLAVGMAQLLLLAPPRPWWRWLGVTSLAWMSAAWLVFSGMALLGSMLSLPAEAWLAALVVAGALVGWLQTQVRQQAGWWHAWWPPMTAVSWGVVNFLLVRIYLGGGSW